jgi:hypothetical protein
MSCHAQCGPDHFRDSNQSQFRGKLEDLPGTSNSDNHYPKTRQQTLHLLDKYSKTAVTKTTNSEGASFAQRHGSGADKKKPPFDKAYWKGKTRFKCNEEDHLASHCPKADKTIKIDKADKEDDAASTASSVNKLKKEIKKMSKVFTTVSAKLEQLKEAESGLSGTDAEKEASHFQYDDAFQFAQLESKFEPKISKLFKQSHVAKITLNLK